MMRRLLDLLAQGYYLRWGPHSHIVALRLGFLSRKKSRSGRVRRGIGKAGPACTGPAPFTSARRGDDSRLARIF